MKTKSSLWLAAFLVAASSINGAETNMNRHSTASDRTIGTVERASKVIGREVRSNSDQKIGKIDDLVVDLESGRILYAVVSAGGFIGVGDRLVAVPVSVFTEQNKQLRLDADKQKLTDAPQFVSSGDKRDEMFSPAFAGSVNKYFGGNATWMEDSSGKIGGKFGNVHTANDLIGMDVRNVSNETIAKVENVMVDLSAGRVPYVVLSPDRSLNLSAGRDALYAIPPNALTASGDGKTLNTGIDKQKLASAPHFNKNQWPDMANHSWATRVYEYFGKEPYFGQGSLQPTSLRTNGLERLYYEPEK
ncbi:MAG TPA: PRC-barrel domain-containing protein [Candidatus Paceibacterota bacterium]|nr:PRC-barrel domain-containing protein [Candidatus Paceibacterota bacterium]